MANAGRILIMPKGNYDASKTYEMLDLVYYNGASWLAKKTVTGIAPSEGEYWQCLVVSAVPQGWDELGDVHEQAVSMSVMYSHAVSGHAVVQRISGEKSNIHMRLQMSNDANKDTVSHLFYLESLRSTLYAESVDMTGAKMLIRVHYAHSVEATNNNRYTIKLDESAFVIYENVNGSDVAVKMSSDACKGGTLYDIDIYGAKVTY